jgi:hypothetical protein
LYLILYIVNYNFKKKLGGRRGRDRMVVPVQSVPITNKVASSNPAHGEVYSIQHYVKLATGRLFSPVTSTNETVLLNITELLLKMALNTITLALTILSKVDHMQYQ